MKKLLFGALALTVLATACKKDDDSSTPANSWKVGTTSYTSVATTASGAGTNYNLSAVQGSSTSVNGITFTFNGSAAPAAGTYKVVNATSTLNANQVRFTATVYNGTTATAYNSTGYDNINATVAVNGGKVSVSMPDATGKSITSSDSVKVSANITQN